MRKPGAKLLIAMLLLLQIVAPVQQVLAMQSAKSGSHEDHCQMQGSHMNQDATGNKKSCAAHCMQSGMSSQTSDQNSTNNCDNDSGCSTSCFDCSHSNVMVLNEFVFMHQTVSHSPITGSYDIFKYFPPLALRPPRV